MMLQLKSGEYLGQVNKNWDADGVLISETAYPVRVFEGWHYHENHHISFIIRGGNKEQREGRETEILPGTIVSYQSGELHRNFNTNASSRNINLEIEASFFTRYDLPPNAFNIAGPGCADAKFATLKIYRECLANAGHSSVAVHSLLLGLLDYLDTTPSIIPKWVSLLRDILHDRWNDNIRLEELARLVQVHPITISKSFSRYFHCTLGEYIRKLRIEKAIQLVQTTDWSLTTIAHHCGFFDQSHFIRVFKNMTGFLPGRYKRLAG
jgi:AraC family transcriptional regulator